jgi:hypothetical protein
MPTTKEHRNAYFPEARTVQDLLDAIPAHVRDLSTIVVVYSREEQGVDSIELVSFDQEIRALVLSHG